MMIQKRAKTALAVFLLTTMAAGQSLTWTPTVEVEGHTYGTAWVGPVGFGGVAGVVSVGQVKTWRGFVGGLSVSEADYHHTAEYTGVTEGAASRQSMASCLTWGGLGTVLVCGTLLLVSAAGSETGNPDPTLGIPSVIGLSAGLVAVLIGTRQKSRNTGGVSSPGVPTPAPAVREPANPVVDLRSALEGCIIVAEDGQLLGLITANAFNDRSFLNKFGPYGSKFSSTSIWNQFGDYGSPYSTMSAFNPHASTPPRIVTANGQLVGYLTVNALMSPAISPQVLAALME